MQERYWEFKDDDLTVRLNSWLMGIIFPGLYAGFDLVVTGNSTITLNHNTTGFVYNDINNNPKNPVGIMIGQGGDIIKEDVAVTLTLTPNSSSAPRLDVIYMQHRYRDGVQGGEQATYGIITGSPSLNLVAPALTDPTTQTIVGYLYVPSGTSVVNSDVKWERSKAPIPRAGLWDSQNRGDLLHAPSGSSSTVELRADVSQKYVTVAPANGASGVHNIYIKNTIVSEDIQWYFNILDFVSAGVNSNFELKIYFVDSISGTLIKSYKQTDFDGSGEVVRLKLRRKGTSYVVMSEDRESDFHSNKRNESRKMDVTYPLTTVNHNPDVSRNTLIEIPDENTYPSYVVFTGAVLNGITKCKPGTRLTIEAGHASGLQINNRQQFGLNGPGAPNISNISFGQKLAGGGIYNVGDIYAPILIRLGQTIDFICNSNGDWVVPNEVWSNQIWGLNNQAVLTDSIISSYKNFFVSSGRIDGAFIAGNGADMNNGADLNNTYVSLPTDGIARSYIISAKAHVSKSNFGAASHARLFIKKGNNPNLVSNTLLDFCSYEHPSTTGTIRSALSCLTTFSSSNVPGNEYISLAIASQGPGSFSWERVVISVLGIPTSIQG